MHHQNSIPFRFYGYTQHRETHSDESTLPLPYPDFDCMAVATFLKMAGLKPHHDVQQPSKKKKKNKSSSDGRKHENESTATRDQYCSDTDPLPRLWLHRLPILESIPSEEQQQQQQADRTRRCKWDPSRTIDGDASKIIQALEEYLAEQKQVYRDWESTHNSAVSSSSDENVGGDSDGFEVISIVDEDRSRRDGAAKSAQQGIKADGILLLNDLDQEQRARLAAIESVVKEKLLACVIHQWFANDANYDNTTYSSYRHQAKGILVKLFLPRWIRNRRLAQMANLLHVDHPGQVSMLHCFALLKECLDLIDDVLGDKSFLFSNDTPSVLDTFTYAYLASLLYPEFQDGRLSKLLHSYPRLIKYCTRITNKYFEHDGMPEPQDHHNDPSFDSTVESIIASTREKERSTVLNRCFLAVALSSISVTLAIQHSRLFAPIIAIPLRILTTFMTKKISAEDIEEYEIDDAL